MFYYEAYSFNANLTKTKELMLIEADCIELAKFVAEQTKKSKKYETVVSRISRDEADKLLHTIAFENNSFDFDLIYVPYEHYF